MPSAAENVKKFSCKRAHRFYLISRPSARLITNASTLETLIAHAMPLKMRVRNNAAILTPVRQPIFRQAVFPKPLKVFPKPLKVVTMYLEIFVTKFVTHITNFVTCVRNFVTHITNFVIKNIL